MLAGITEAMVEAYLSFLDGGLSLLGLLILDDQATKDVDSIVKRPLTWMRGAAEDSNPVVLHFNTRHRK